MHPENSGTLYLVPTPIGNLEDITLRAIRILKMVDCVAAEDTRHSLKLLNHFGISTRLVSYYREKEQQRSDVLLNLLHEGKNVALVTDAGTPGISDPGAVLVSRAHEEGVKVVPLPGPSALTTALSAAGITHPGFVFIGFLPAKQGQRKKILQSLVNCEQSLVFYESVHRIAPMLEDALNILGDRTAFWARELTKSHEDLRRAQLSELVKISRESQNRGEFVIIIWPGEKTPSTNDQMEERLRYYRDNSDISVRDASKIIADELSMPKSKIYKRALEIWKERKQ